MALTGMASYLADKSALARVETSVDVNAALDPLLVSGEIATCGVVDLELLYSAPHPSTSSDTGTRGSFRSAAAVLA